MSSGLEVADVVRRHGGLQPTDLIRGEAYRRAHDAHLGRIERRVMSAIELCRTAALGGHTEACADCGRVRCAYNSCRNRHCPKSGAGAPSGSPPDRPSCCRVPYFHVVFTLPALVAEIALQNQARIYAILFRTTAKTLRTIGRLAVRHTWGQNPHYHPHVDCVVPGGGPSLDHTRLSPAAPGSSCRFAYSRLSSGGFSSPRCAPPLPLANSASSASLQRSRDPPL
jgi:hypothetical protein